MRAALKTLAHCPTFLSVLQETPKSRARNTLLAVDRPKIESGMSAFSQTHFKHKALASKWPNLFNSITAKKIQAKKKNVQFDQDIS